MANWIGVVVGIMGLLLALRERRERTRVETAIGSTISRLSGEVFDCNT